MVRVIGHLDLDYFYAQVEEVEDPALKKRPVVVCVFSGRTDDSGVVSTANYLARGLGVKSGMPIVQAKKKLLGADAAVIKMEHEKYEAVSERVMAIVEGEVDILEQAGIDEAFFDLTSRAKEDYQLAASIARRIKGEIRGAEGLTCSVGLGRSKSVAKLGSDSNKPDGLTVITPESTEGFLFPLDVSKLYGVGPKTEATLAALGIKTVGELARSDPQALERSLGRKLAAYLLAASTGSDAEPVVPGALPTQVSRIITLKRDTRDPTEAVEQLAAASQQIQSKLSSSGRTFRTLTAIGILADLSTHTKSKTFESPAAASGRFSESALDLFTELSRAVDKDFRRVGLRVSGLDDPKGQASLSDFVGQEQP